jgi:hypothetical protein
MERPNHKADQGGATDLMALLRDMPQAALLEREAVFAQARGRVRNRDVLPPT